ncbi:MAG: hypothetical protein ACTSVI_07190 [Promethearchaeota archaeon]
MNEEEKENDDNKSVSGDIEQSNDNDFVYDVYIYEDVLEEIEARCRNNVYEIIGNLIGNVYQWRGKEYVIIIGYVFSEQIEKSPIFTKVIDGALGEMAKQKEERYPDSIIVGWWHSHPDLGVFLSSVDISTMEMYDKTYHVALVVDPIRDERAFFKIDDSRHYHPVSYAVLKGSSEDKNNENEKEN